MKKVKSKCCNASVKLGETEEHRGTNEHWTMHEFYVCMKCGEICETVEEKCRKKKEDYENSY